MKRSPLLITLGLVGAFLAIVVVVFLSRSDETPQRITMGEIEDVQPSADNVDPTFHARLMALRAELDTAPQDTSKLLELAHLHQDAHQMAEAVALYERVLAIEPRHRQTHLDLALCYSELGRWEDAQRTMQQMLAAYPDDPSALYNLGAIHANQGQFDDARNLWLRVQSQAQDVDLASQASSSLAQIDAMALTPQAPSAANPSGASTPRSSIAPPPIPADQYEPVIAGQ